METAKGLQLGCGIDNYDQIFLLDEPAPKAYKTATTT